MSVAKVPLISGDTQDEGTILALGALSIQTEDNLRSCTFGVLSQAIKHDDIGLGTHCEQKS